MILGVRFMHTMDRGPYPPYSSGPLAETMIPLDLNLIATM